jgi:precorrin isomerase
LDKKALIHALFENPVSPEEIEQRSFDAIDSEFPNHGFSPEQWVVVRRMIHTTANFDLAKHARFSPDALDSAVMALGNGRPIYADSNMIRSGISLARLKSVNPAYSAKDVCCNVAEADVAEEAKKAGLPRSLFAVRKAKEQLDGGIAVFGNAPVALMELNRMVMEENIRPALVIAMPVGFVHVVESKEELMSLGVPYIAMAGRFGGSPMAVSVIHSLCSIAVERRGA